MKIKASNSKITGIPDYYEICIKWNKKYRETGNPYCKKMAYHFAKLADEFGQAKLELEGSKN